MTINYNDLLEHRHTRYIKWFEPWKGLSKDENEIDAHVCLIASVHDCINISRMAVSKHVACVDEISDADLLAEFITIHWATILPEDYKC